jgi:hypothetical protein
VLLGASNLARGLGSALACAQSVWGSPLDVLAALGLGRSYGLPRGVLWHTLPGIVECGLWQALADRPAAPTAALVTDVGNDLLYEAPVADIFGWVRVCVDNLLRAGARVVLTGLPLCSVGRLSRTKFLLLRSVLFPGCRLDLATVVDRACALDEQLRTLAAERGLLLVEHLPVWYGFDPIHVRRRHRAAAWRTMMGRWAEGVPATARRCSLRRWWALCGLAPERRSLFGRERRREQPAAVLADGTRISLY